MDCADSDAARVSVVVPVHNEERTLDWCLISIRRQKVGEIIIVLDRCEDRSEQVSRKHAAEDLRIRIYSLRRHTYRTNYYGETLNSAISKARNSLVCVVDGDTVLGHDYISSLVPFIKGSCVSVSGRLIPVYKRLVQFSETVRGTGRLFPRWVWDQTGGFKDILACDTFFDLELLRRGYEVRVREDALMYDMRDYSMRDLVKRALRRGKGRRQMAQSLPFMIGHGLYYLTETPFGIVELIGNIAGYFTAQRKIPSGPMRQYEAKRIKEIIERFKR